MAGVTAIAAVDAAAVEPDHRVLVAGATGGIGNQVVQLAAKSGAHVLATATSEQGRALVSDLGAAAAVDHTGDVLAAVRREHADGVDAVVHLAGDPHALLAALRPGGRFVSTMIMSPDQLPTEDATVIAIYANPDVATLDRAVGQHVDGTSRVHLQDTFSLDQAPAAFAAFTGGKLGKLVITTA